MNRRKQNVLFVHANNYDVGGSDYCLFKLAATLDRTRFNPIVLLGLETEIANKYRAHCIPLMIVPMYRIRKTKEALYHAKFVLNLLPTVLRIVSIIRRYKIDIVHSNDFLDVYGPIAARLANVKSIQHVRLIMSRPVWLKKVLCGFVRAVNHRIVVVSDGVGQAMFLENGKVHSMVVTCYDWVDMDLVGHSDDKGDFRKEIGASAQHVVVGAVGRLEPWKGQHVFVKAVGEVVKEYPDARFVIVGGKVTGRGREKYEDELRTLACELQIENQLYFVGSRSDISNVMCALDIYVHCSVEPDPLPGVVMESMAMSRPVIGPRAGGVPEEVEEGVTGLLYEPGDSEDMAKAICKLIASPQLAERFRIAGKQRANTVFDKELLCRQMENVYEDILND